MRGSQRGWRENRLEYTNPERRAAGIVAEFPEGTVEYRDHHTRNMVAGKLGSVQQNNYHSDSKFIHLHKIHQRAV